MAGKGKPIEMDVDEWIAYGIAHNWCGPPVCYMHDGLPTSLAEDEDLDEGHDPCLHILRLYEAPEERLMVEDNHSPSQWRNSFGV